MPCLQSMSSRQQREASKTDASAHTVSESLPANARSHGRLIRPGHHAATKSRKPAAGFPPPAAGMQSARPLNGLPAEDEAYDVSNNGAIEKVV